MGVDFYLYQVKRKHVPKSNVALPGIEARFAATEYPRFLDHLAQEAGIGDAWGDYRQAAADLSSALAKQVFVAFDPERPFGYKSKKERRRAKKKARRDGQSPSPAPNPEIEVLKRRVEDARKAVEDLADVEPLVVLLLSPLDSGRINGELCHQLGPRIRAIAEKWEPAPEGWVGWRERALEIANAMDIAAQHPDVVFGISG
jgi:hypothetical protein